MSQCYSKLIENIKAALPFITIYFGTSFSVLSRKDCISLLSLNPQFQPNQHTFMLIIYAESEFNISCMRGTFQITNILTQQEIVEPGAAACACCPCYLLDGCGWRSLDLKSSRSAGVILSLNRKEIKRLSKVNFQVIYLVTKSASFSIKLV